MVTGTGSSIQGEDSIIDRTMREKEVCGNETRRSGGSIDEKIVLIDSGNVSNLCTLTIDALAGGDYNRCVPRENCESYTVFLIIRALLQVILHRKWTGREPACTDADRARINRSGILCLYGL